MNKFLRIISTLIVGIGLILLFVYLSFQSSIDKSQVLNQPSYYSLQNYWYLLVAGCGCVAFSMISCFLAWNRKMDEKIEILPNAVAAEKTELLSWLSGSSLDTAKKRKHKAETTGQEKRTGTQVEKRTDETDRPGKTARKTVSDMTDATAAAGDETAITASGEAETARPGKTARKTESDMTDATATADDETVIGDSEETEVAQDETILERISPVTVSDSDETVLNGGTHTAFDDDSTVIARK